MELIVKRTDPHITQRTFSYYTMIFVSMFSILPRVLNVELIESGTTKCLLCIGGRWDFVHIDKCIINPSSPISKTVKPMLFSSWGHMRQEQGGAEPAAGPTR